VRSPAAWTPSWSRAALVLAAELWGAGTAMALQLGIEYDPAPPFDCGTPEKAPPALVAAVRAGLPGR
jgi:cyclohexyl-isocyanide hydratase